MPQTEGEDGAGPEPQLLPVRIEVYVWAARQTGRAEGLWGRGGPGGESAGPTSKLAGFLQAQGHSQEEVMSSTPMESFLSPLV